MDSSDLKVLLEEIKVDLSFEDDWAPVTRQRVRILVKELAILQAERDALKESAAHNRPWKVERPTVYTINSAIIAGHSEHATFVLEMNYKALEQELATATKRIENLTSNLEAAHTCQDLLKQQLHEIKEAP